MILGGEVTLRGVSGVFRCMWFGWERGRVGEWVVSIGFGGGSS